jgi:enamine deaminase RidA (YjgF/YER057c/UK114 family)
VWRFLGHVGLIEEWVHGHSRAIVQDPFVFVTSTTGFDYVQMAIAESVAAQTQDAWGIIANVLMQVDSDLSEIVTCKYHVTDQSDVGLIMRTSKMILDGVCPAVTLVVLPRLPHPQAIVAIEVTAMWGAHASGATSAYLNS